MEERTFAEALSCLRSRVLAGEGNFRQALSYLAAAESLERQAGLLPTQRDAIKAQDIKAQSLKNHSVEGNRIGVRMSHLAHAIMRTVKQRDQYLAMAETAIAS